MAGEPDELTAREIAIVLGVSRDWVYRHRDELGAVQDGRGRLGFNPEKALRAWNAMQQRAVDEEWEAAAAEIKLGIEEMWQGAARINGVIDGPIGVARFAIPDDQAQEVFVYVSRALTAVRAHFGRAEDGTSLTDRIRAQTSLGEPPS